MMTGKLEREAADSLGDWPGWKNGSDNPLINLANTSDWRSK